MKKNAIISGSVLLFSVLFFSACRKEIKEPTINTETETQSRSDHDHERNQCRMVNFTSSDGSFENDYYNREGLVSHRRQNYLNYGFDWFTAITYDHRGHLEKAKIYDLSDGGAPLYVIQFKYDKGRLDRYEWYFADDMELEGYDQISYDWKGRIKRKEWFGVDGFSAHTTFEYDRWDNMIRVHLYFYDVSVYYFTYSYTRQIKNPNRTLKGIPFDFILSDEIWSPLLYTGAEGYFWDADAGVFVNYYKVQPSGTVITVNNRRYPETASWTDVLSGQSLTTNWQYRNCGGHHDNDDRSAPELKLLQENKKPTVKKSYKEIILQRFKGNKIK